MAYSLKPGRVVSADVARIVRKQVHLAAAQLRARCDSPEEVDRIHRARRHIKKAAAALRLAKPALGGGTAKTAARLDRASHLISTISDARAMVQCIDRLTAARGFVVDDALLGQVRAGLTERSARVDRKAAVDNAMVKAVRLLERSGSFVPAPDASVNGFKTVAPGLERSVRRARKLMHRVAAEPTLARTHRWRRRVKDLWYQVRLLNRRCGNGLRTDCTRLEVLDGLLGEWRNLALVEAALLDEPLLSRDATARLLRHLRRRKSRLRRRALALGARTLAEGPEDFVDRAGHLWAHARQRRRPHDETAACRHA